MFWNPMGLQFLCFLSLTPLNGYEVTGKIPNINISYCWPMSPTRNNNTKITKNQKPNWNQNVLKSNGFTVFVFFSLTPLNGYEVTGEIATMNMFILLTYVTYSEWQYKNIKIQNTETKLKSKCFEIRWVYSFCVFFL